MDIIAHRGFAHDGPENTMGRFSDAEEFADYIELDVIGSSDEVPVIVHDKHLERLCGVDKLVREIPVDEVTRQSVQGSEEKIPRLSTVLDRIEIPVVVEIKDREIVEETVELCRESECEVVFQSFYPEVMKALPGDVEKMVLCTPERFLDVDGVPDTSITTLSEAAELADRIGAEGINPHHSMCDGEEFGSVSDRYNVFAWTVRSEETADELEENEGVDGWITDSIEYVTDG